MGKRKQRKPLEETKNKKFSFENQENQSSHGNYQTPSRQIVGNKQTDNKKMNVNMAEGYPHQIEQQTNSQCVVNSNHSSNKSGQKAQQDQQAKISAPSCEDNQQLRKIIQFQSDEKNIQQTHITNKQQVENNIQTSNKQSSTMVNLQRNQQNQLRLALDNNKREYIIESGFDSGNEDEGVEYYDEEDEEQETIQNIYQNNNHTGQFKNNYNYQINDNDDIEPTQYNSKRNHQNSKIQNQQFNSKNFRDNKQLQNENQQLRLETFIKGDEQIQSDIKFCLYCIYNNHDISQYFKQLLRLRGRLKEWSFQITPNTLFSIFEDNINEFMQGIKDRIIEEMRSLRMIRQKPIQKRYSFDDYMLIDKTFSKSYSLHGYNNEILSHCMKYMSDSRYESIRSDLRYRIWSEMRKSNEILVSFYQQPDSFQKVFDLIIKFYTRVRDSVVGIEEIWLFLMESVFQQELKGNMIFEQFHKQLFKKDILGHRYLSSFLKEINEVQLDLENRRVTKQENVLDPIIENISQILFELDEDLNFTFPEEDEETLKTQGNQQFQNNQEDFIETNDEDFDDQDDIIVTYQQLQDKMRLQYGGQSLAQQVDQYSRQSSDYLNILQQFQQDKRCQQLMKNLPNLDTDTLVYIIENNLSRKDYEAILLQNQQKLQKTQYNNQDESGQDDIIISPSKNLNFLNQYFTNIQDEMGDNQNNSGSNDDDDDEKTEKQQEKKKKKNKKKKRKRKEKKILAQHQNQIEVLLKSKLIEEQFKRCDEEKRQELRKVLMRNLGADQISIPIENPQNYKDSCEMETRNLVGDNDNDSTADMEQDLQFEKELELFRQRLEIPVQGKEKRSWSKLVPNITESWIDQLRQRLRDLYDFKSPRGSALSKGKAEMNSISGGLWLKFHQHSA